MKYFTPDDVNKLIPTLEKIIPALQQLKHSIDEKAYQLQRRKAAAERAGRSGRGSDEFMAEEAEIEFLIMQAQLQVRRLEELGGQLKGLQPGLVDFPGLVDGEPVLLCWRQGETRVRYYHGEDEGFAGRRLLPEEEAAPDDAAGAGPGGTDMIDGAAGGAQRSARGWPSQFTEFAAADAGTAPLPDAAREFLYLFNTVEDYFTAHDVLEEYWRHVDTDNFWKALIQVAVGFVHLGRGNLNGCRILWRRAARYLQPYEPAHRGLDVAALRRRLLADAEIVSADPACQPGARVSADEAAAWVERLRYRL